MATIRNVGSQGEPVGPWEGLQAVITAIDHHEDPGAQMRASLIFMTSCIKSLSPKEMAEAMRFSADELGNNLLPL